MSIEVYLDNSATTKPRKEVVYEMMIPLTEVYGNPSSLHSMGVRAEKLIKESKENVAKLIGCTPQEIVFTSGGTEANNISIRGVAYANKNKGNHLITTKFEHSSCLNTFKSLELEGFKVSYISIHGDGTIDLRHLEECLSEDTILVSIMMVNSEVGTIQPILEAAKLIRKHSKNAKFHVDAVQAFTKMELNPIKLDIDLMTMSSHKIHGPKGVGCIYIKKGSKVLSIIYGGGQEYGIRPGTENVPGVVGFGKACELQHIHMKKDNERITRLREDFENKVLSLIPDTILNGSKENRAPHISNISFLGVRGEVLLHALEGKGIYVSTGSACSSHAHKLSHVLQSMGASKEQMEGAIRFSLSGFNTEEEIDYCVENLESIVKELRKFKRR